MAAWIFDSSFTVDLANLNKDNFKVQNALRVNKSKVNMASLDIMAPNTDNEQKLQLKSEHLCTVQMKFFIDSSFSGYDE